MQLRIAYIVRRWWRWSWWCWRCCRWWCRCWRLFKGLLLFDNLVGRLFTHLDKKYTQRSIVWICCLNAGKIYIIESAACFDVTLGLMGKPLNGSLLVSGRRAHGNSLINKTVAWRPVVATGLCCPLTPFATVYRFDSIGKWNFSRLFSSTSSREKALLGKHLLLRANLL